MKETQYLDSVPPIADFRKLWMRRYDGERHLKDPMPSSIQLVLGLFTVAPDVEYREVVRKTWFKQAGVCYWQRQPRDGCSVYVAFVVGKSGMGETRVGEKPRPRARMSAAQVEATHREPGVLVLDTPENMNGDKSPLWFDAARQFFPWATHVGKMDMDTYPFLHKLVHRMEAGRACSLGLGPYEVIGRPHDTSGMGPVFMHECGGRRCTQFLSLADTKPNVAPLGRPWRFLSGEFYILSMPLVQQANWTLTLHGSEDLIVAKHISEAAKRRGFCVVQRRLDSWFHRNTWHNESYANDLEG